jgi:hypothetical protein
MAQAIPVENMRTAAARVSLMIPFFMVYLPMG